MNVDSNQIGKFNELAHMWWDKQGKFKPLHEINPLRLQFILEHTNIAGKNILDIGCGGGILSEAMAIAGAKVTGIDLAEQALQVAKEHARKTDVAVDYRCISAENFAAEHAGEFDIVTCMEMLEHVPEPESIIAACSRLVKPGGHIFFSTINRNAKAFLMAIVGAEHILRMIPQGTHEYDKFIKPAELTGWCREVGLQPKAMQGMHYNPLSKRYKLNADCDVNYLVYTQKTLA